MKSWPAALMTSISLFQVAYKLPQEEVNWSFSLPVLQNTGVLKVFMSRTRRRKRVLIRLIHQKRYMALYYSFSQELEFYISIPSFKYVWIYLFGCAGSSLLLRLSLVGDSRGYSWLWSMGFSLWWPLLLLSSGSRCMGFCSHSMQAWYCSTGAHYLWLAGPRTCRFQ